MLWIYMNIKILSDIFTLICYKNNQTCSFIKIIQFLYYNSLLNRDCIQTVYKIYNLLQIDFLHKDSVMWYTNDA